MLICLEVAWSNWSVSDWRNVRVSASSDPCNADPMSELCVHQVFRLRETPSKSYGIVYKTNKFRTDCCGMCVMWR